MNWTRIIRRCERLRSSISEAKRQTFVGQCLTEARVLVAAGKGKRRRNEFGRREPSIPMIPGWNSTKRACRGK